MQPHVLTTVWSDYVTRYADAYTTSCRYKTVALSGDPLQYYALPFESRKRLSYLSLKRQALLYVLYLWRMEYEPDLWPSWRNDLSTAFIINVHARASTIFFQTTKLLIFLILK